MARAVIFDCDGVLLELTRPEEEVFFQAFAPLLDATGLSRDWNSYRIRNDEDIAAEILARHGLPASDAPAFKARYLALLNQALATGRVKSLIVPHVRNLLTALAPRARLGLATANFLPAARLRLERARLWQPVSSLAFGAEGGGSKTVILGRTLAASGLDPAQVVYVGDNVTDVMAARSLAIPFLGFSRSALRRRTLLAAGAASVTNNHLETLRLITAHLSGEAPLRPPSRL